MNSFSRITTALTLAASVVLGSVAGVAQTTQEPPPPPSQSTAQSTAKSQPKADEKERFKTDGPDNQFEAPFRQ